MVNIQGRACLVRSATDHAEHIPLQQQEDIMSKQRLGHNQDAMVLLFFFQKNPSLTTGKGAK